MKSDFSSRLKYGVSALAVASTLSMTAQVTQAQEADAEEGMMFEEVVVTGSRIKRKDIESVAPLVVTGAEEVKFSGYNRVEDLLNSLPQLEAGQTAFISNGASGTANLDLRGLSPIRTLVLVNGRRLQPGGINSRAADINQIPTALIKNVEVMTGGGASTYGADAVAGVVNFIMDKEFEGVQMSAGIAAYQHNNGNDYIQGLMDEKGFEYPTGSSGLEGWQYTLDMTVGGSFAEDKGHAVAYVNYRKVDELRQESRDYSSCALSGGGTSCGGSGNAIVPNFYLGGLNPDGSFNWDEYYGYYTLDANSNFVPSVGNQYNYAPPNHFQRPDEKFSGGAFINYEINDNFKPYIELGFMNDRTSAQIAESGTFFAETLSISCSNPMLSAAQVQAICTDNGLGADDSFATYIGKRNVEGDPRRDVLEHTSYRIVAGTEGQIDDNWSYDVSVLYAATASSSTYLNDFHANLVSEAIDVTTDGDGNLVCTSGRSGCVPYNVFTYQGVTAEAANALLATAQQTGFSSELVINGYVTGELPVTIAEDPISTVFGVEYRKEKYENISSYVYEQGLLNGQGGPTPSVAGHYDVKEFFAEAYVPIVQNSEFAQELSMELGFRYSDYKTSSDSSYDATTYRIGLNWQPIDEIKLRGSYNRAVRAPNVYELFEPQNLGLWNGDDPCAGDVPVYTAAQCANTGVTDAQYTHVVPSPASQYNALYGGNPDLQPEKADTWTVGFVAHPMDNMNISVDYWDIKITDVVGYVGAATALQGCATTGLDTYCDLINRSGSGSLWLGTEGYVVATNANLGLRHWKGIDFSADYLMDFDNGGSLTVNMLGTLLLDKIYRDIAEDASTEYNCKGVYSDNCFASPKWRHTLRVTYNSGDFWTVSAKWRYYASIDGEDADVGSIDEDGIGAQSYFDLTASFDVTEQVGLVMGVNNIFDKEPPLVGGRYSTNANTIAGYYDTLGRYLHAKVTAKF
ncbi:TonB-dependent receptor plug domain-containing protein [Emcibacter nanhaiensis]|uniref:TonB-dependent receptor n=1 Tax=Emcibacter nanhaiensis TaxID=1505037 RepID=A0A501PEN9_9PROT|nr:TonB-dependent receptor [Emcibacter nanhaiensis]TPD58909.1 TonB-dependent receptor [Emcibacter nanhaiensis]